MHAEFPSKKQELKMLSIMNSWQMSDQQKQSHKIRSDYSVELSDIFTETQMK